MTREFWPFWWGGLVIGSIAALYPLLSGRALGVSSLYAALFDGKPAKLEDELDLEALKAAMLAETEAEFGPTSTNQEPASEQRLATLRAEAEPLRWLFLPGMLLGAFAISAVSSGFGPALTLGESFDLRYGEFGIVPVLVLVISGVLIGIGTRLAGGCTSGHGISGMARGQLGSLVSTPVFWGTALAVAWVFACLRGS